MLPWIILCVVCLVFGLVMSIQRSQLTSCERYASLLRDENFELKKKLIRQRMGLFDWEERIFFSK